MMQSLKAEIRKLLTVRATTVILIACLLIVMFFAGYVEGVRASAQSLTNPKLLMGESQSAVLFTGLIFAFAGLLLFGHEYRYNTIMYTLTSTNKRLKPYFAKALAITIFSVVFGIIIAFFSPLCTKLGLSIGGHHPVTQQFDIASIVWRCAFCAWGYTMYAFILVAIIRSQIGALVTYLLIPLMGENILIALLKDNAKYLPFTSLQSVAGSGALQGTTTGSSALIALLYIIVGLAVGAFLFLRRDAN